MDTKTLLEQVDAAISRLALVREIIVQGEMKLPASIAIEAEAGICHTCKKPLGKEKPVRGCHRACAQAVRREIKSGDVTEADVMKAGRYGPASPPGRKKRFPAQALLAGAQDDATLKADAAQKREAQKRSKKDATN